MKRHTPYNTTFEMSIAGSRGAVDGGGPTSSCTPKVEAPSHPRGRGGGRLMAAWFGGTLNTSA